MLGIMEQVLIFSVLGPAAAAALVWSLGRRAPRRMGQLGAATAGVALVGTVMLAVAAVRGEPVSTALGPLDLTADRLAVVVLVLIFGVSAIVQAFAVRYLAGDPRARWFSAAAGLLTAASAGLVTADTLVGLALFWTLAGISLCLLLATYWHLPDARDGVRRAALAFLVGDIALWAAVVLATATWGGINLRAVEGGEPGGAVLSVVAVLIVLAALSRSAQIPFHRWLPATLAAPTPVSALLHAGVVNAGGILLIRLAPLSADGAARVLTIMAGAATLAYGAVIMIVKPDVKGALVNSTAAQMGFMILTCGLGLWAAAVVHLVAHGFYKSALFLSSGSAVSARRWHRSLPPVAGPAAGRNTLNLVAAALLPAAAVAAAVAVVPLPAGDHAAAHALLIFAWATGAAAVLGWLRHRPGAGGVLLAAAFLLPAAIAYVAIVSALSGFLAPSLPAATLAVPTVWVIALGAATALAALAAARRIPGTGAMQRALYAEALSAGHVTTTGARS